MPESIKSFLNCFFSVNCMYQTILLLSRSVTLLQKLLYICECELAWLDMSLNFCKSCCIRIGPRCDRTCISVKSLSGHCLPWNTKMRCLGVYIVQSRNMKCSLDACKRSFYRAANSIFGKNGRIASAELFYTWSPQNVFQFFSTC